MHGAHLLYEPEYVIPSAGNITEENSRVNIFDYFTRLSMLEVC
jgi:hypothetical protein